MTFKPMLAVDAEMDKVKFPMLVSVKLDGIRALIVDGVVMSRNMTPFPNKQLQAKFGRPEFNNFDGELIDGPPTAKDAFARSQSVTKSHDKKVHTTMFYVFDIVCDLPFQERVAKVSKTIMDLDTKRICSIVQQQRVENVEELVCMEDKVVEAGWEGLMGRSLESPYKHGRSTVKEGYLLKFKRFSDDEAQVLGAIEQERNDNVATTDALGHTKRASLKGNMVGKGTLGAFQVKILTGKFKDVTMTIGTGWTAAERHELWTSYMELGDPEAFARKWGVINFKHQPSGADKAPRFPIFNRWTQL